LSGDKRWGGGGPILPGRYRELLSWDPKVSGEAQTALAIGMLMTWKRESRPATAETEVRTDDFLAAPVLAQQTTAGQLLGSGTPGWPVTNGQVCEFQDFRRQNAALSLVTVSNTLFLVGKRRPYYKVEAPLDGGRSIHHSQVLVANSNNPAGAGRFTTKNADGKNVNT